MSHDNDDFDVQASRAVVPYFYRAPTPAHTKPREYQLAGVEFALSRRNAIIGDAPGVGKTAQCIALSNAIEARHTLVVCPASLRLNWEKEIREWSTLEEVTTSPVLKSTSGISRVSNYVIISYALLANAAILGALLDHRWDHLILDEAHAIKDPKGNTRTRAICAPDCLPRVVGRITLATGTLLPNQPIECYNAMRLCDWDSIDKMSLEDFREFYYGRGGGMVRGKVLKFNKATGQEYWKSELHWSADVRNQPRNLDDLQHRLRKHLMVRRLKEQVLHELPPKVWQPFPMMMTSAIRKALQHPGWKSAEKLYALDEGAFNHGIPIDGEVGTAWRELGEAKAPGVADYIEDLLDSGVRKLVVAAHHISVLHAMRDRLAKHGLVYMDGSTSSVRKQAAVDQFQNDDRVKIIMGQEMPLGEGWTLTAAQDVILTEPSPVPGRNDQVLDRIHRFGQTGEYVIGHLPVVPGTLDERFLGSAIRKDKHIHAALDKRREAA